MSAPDRSRAAREPASGAVDAAERSARALWSLLAEPTDTVALLVCDRLGHRAALELARRGDPADLARALREEDAAATLDREAARLALDRWRRRLGTVAVGGVLEDAERRGIRLLVPGDADWPPALADLREGAPHALWATGPGSLDALVTGRGVAVVGSRASTPYGEDTAGHLAAGIAARGGTVVSGGAYGIDAAAHRGALAAEGGATVAVLAGGLDRLYPRGNSGLLEEIARRHLLVSEAPPGTAPTRWRFLSRNRLIAALAGAVVVVEASWRSGALSTARHADDLSRPVAAVPGPVTSAASAGCHRLVRERGAVLVTDVDEVLELLPGGIAAGPGRFAVQDELDLLDAADRQVLDAIPPRSATTWEQVSRETGQEPPRVRAAGARLVLLGLVAEAGERVRRARP